MTKLILSEMCIKSCQNLILKNSIVNSWRSSLDPSILGWKYKRQVKKGDNELSILFRSIHLEYGEPSFFVLICSTDSIGSVPGDKMTESSGSNVFSNSGLMKIVHPWMKWFQPDTQSVWLKLATIDIADFRPNVVFAFASFHFEPIGTNCLQLKMKGKYGKPKNYLLAEHWMHLFPILSTVNIQIFASNHVEFWFSSTYKISQVELIQAIPFAMKKLVKLFTMIVAIWTVEKGHGL